MDMRMRKAQWVGLAVDAGSGCVLDSIQGLKP